MMSSDKSPKAREWLNGVHAQVKQGGWDLANALSHHAGAALSPDPWASVISFVCAYEKKAGREAMMKTVLAHPDYPRNTSQVDNGSCMLDAVRRRAIECIPLLHAAGFSLQPQHLPKSDHDYLIVGKLSNEISSGRWPHVELIYPQLLENHSSHRDIVEGIFNETTRQGYHVCNNLVKLPGNAHLTRLISKRLGQMGGQWSVLDEDGINKAIIPLRSLLSVGWIDFDLARREALEDDKGQIVLPIITILEREELAQQTSPASQRKTRSRL
jgi:hypothetical protein